MWQPTQQRDGEGRRREVFRGNGFSPPRVATGVMATACLHTEGPRNTGSPSGGRRASQPDAREGQAGPCGVADRLVVPVKPLIPVEGRGLTSGASRMWSSVGEWPCCLEPPCNNAATAEGATSTAKA